MRHLIDSPPKLAECPRCSGYVLAAMVDGFRVAVDTTPLAGVEGLRSALVDGKSVYAYETPDGGSPRLTALTPHSQTLTRAHRTVHVASHGCGAHGMDAKLFEEPEEEGENGHNPPQAPATDGEHQGGHHPEAAHDSQGPTTQPPEAAAPAKPPLSDNGRDHEVQAEIDAEESKRVIAEAPRADDLIKQYREMFPEPLRPDPEAKHDARTPVEPPPSKWTGKHAASHGVVGRCHNCHAIIKRDDDHVALEWPKQYRSTYRISGRKKKAAQDVDRPDWGTGRWIVHAEEKDCDSGYLYELRAGSRRRDQETR